MATETVTGKGPHAQQFPWTKHPEPHTRAYAESLDNDDPLAHLRHEYIMPSKAALKSKTLAPPEDEPTDSSPCIYLCGNSLGLQPRRTLDRVQSHLDAWATKGVLGHFSKLEDSPLPPFLDTDELAAELLTPVVGAVPGEVAVMETLTANLHLLMTSFYRPDSKRWKIIMEGKAFPSDHYAVESQIRHHNLDPATARILIEPSSSSGPPLMSTAHILSVIDAHASTTALLLLPGIQYYTGQFFEVAEITAYAHARGIVVGWDMAHAAGNVELKLHDWDVDFAVWCNYKYLNGGPGAIAAMFVHERHGQVSPSPSQLASSPTPQKGEETPTQQPLHHGTREPPHYRPRLTGWWGGSKPVRFLMDNHFVPIPGAAGYQVGNPCALALSAVIASLEIFALTDMAALRRKSVLLTAYLEHLLLLDPEDSAAADEESAAADGEAEQGFNGAVSPSHGGDGTTAARPYTIITPRSPAHRGAQLSVRLRPGLLDRVMASLTENGVVVDERRPDVVRVAPAPMYNSFVDVWDFVQIFRGAVGAGKG